MNKLYIFGNSFTLKSNCDYSWINQLDNAYSVLNLSRSGENNGGIFLKFLEYRDTITEDDVIIICWSDYHRFYVNDPSIFNKKKTLERTYYEYFYNKELLKYQSHGYLDQIVKIVEQKNFKMLFFWAIPTEFKNMANWIDTKFDYLSTDSYVYSHDLKNEVRPALIYFSRKEIDELISKNEKALINLYQHDSRPSHISDKNVHNELFNIVDEFIKDNVSGIINLEDRLKNGS
jgi:hypothetical protein